MYFILGGGLLRKTLPHIKSLLPPTDTGLVPSRGLFAEDKPQTSSTADKPFPFAEKSLAWPFLVAPISPVVFSILNTDSVYLLY